MKCLMVKNELKAYIDGELGPIARWRIARHLARCIDCSVEVEAMTDLTNQVGNAGAVPAPQGLKDKVMGKIHFEPVQTTASKWPYKTKPIAVVGVLIFTVVAAAVIMPTFNRAKMAGTDNAGGMRVRLSPAPMEPSTTASPSQRMAPKITKNSDFDANTVGRVDSSTTAAATVDLDKYKGYLAKPTENVSPGDTVTDAFAPLMIIKTADLSVLVASYSQASDQAVAAARSAGGYVTDSSTNSEAGVPTSGTMTIRVPSTHFEKVVEQLGKMGKVTSKTMGGEDVSAEYIDLDSQLRNKRAEERQYLDIMNKAKRVTDIVTVSNELYRVRGEIEEMTGRMKYLKSSATMSTINLTLSEKEKPKPAPQGMIQRSFSDALASLVGTLGRIAGLLIWLVVYSPFWAVPVLGIVYWRRRGAAQARTSA